MNRKGWFWGIVVFGVLAASAGTYNWTGAENGFWTNANNWAEGAVPGRWYGRDAEGHLVTNGAPCDVVYFGDAVKGAKATTISFDGVHSISNLLTTGRTVRYTYGTAATQYVPIAALGTFSAGETADTLVATVACRLRTGTDCFEYNVNASTGAYSAKYGGDMVTIRNNSSEMFVVGDWGYRTCKYSDNKDPEHGNVTIGNETGLCLDGTGDIRFTASAKSHVNPQTTYRLTGTLRLACDFSMRAFNVKGTQGTREIVVEAGGKFRHAGPYYNFLGVDSGIDLLISGEGQFVFGAGYNAGQTVKWKCSQNSINGSLTVTAPVGFVWTTAPTEANGGTTFTPYFWQNGSGRVVFKAPSSELSNGLLWAGNSANSVFEVESMGLRGTAGSHGDADFRVANNTTVRYVGAGETSDRAFIIQDGTPDSATKSVAKTATIEQAGTGPLVLNSAIDAATGTTLTFANSTDQDATFAATIPVGVSVVKKGTGVWKFAGVNAYTGTTKIEAGTLAICSGASVASSSDIQISAGAALVFEGADTYAVQKITPMGAGATVMVAAGATLDLGTLPASAVGTLNIVTADKTAKVKISSATGSAPNWLTINGNVAEFGEDGILQKLSVPTDVNIAVYGGVIPNDAAKSVGITTVGDPVAGPITLAADATAVHTLAQKTTTPAEVSLASGQALTATRLYVEEEKADLSVTGVGTLKAKDDFTIWTDGSNATVTVSSAFDPSAATSLQKIGAGTAVLPSLGAYNKTVNIADGTLMVETMTMPGATLAGAGTFVKTGSESWTPTKDQTGFVGDYVVAGGTVTPGVAAAGTLFGDTTGALVITNGAALHVHKDAATAASTTYGSKEIRLSGSGPDGKGALVINADVGSTPFCRMTLDGDSAINVSVDGTKSTGWGLKSGVAPVFNMNGHTLVKNGTGRLVFSSTTFTNMGSLVCSDVDPFANGDWRNFIVFVENTTFATNENSRITAGNGARLVVQNVRTPVPVPLVVTGTNVQFATFASNQSATNMDNWAGPIELQGEASRLLMYAYGDQNRFLRISGDITGEGALGNVRAAPYGRYEVLGTNNTYAGMTDFCFSTGSGRYMWARFAGPHSIPDYTKTSFDYYGTANLPFGEGLWDATSFGRLLREATFAHEAMLAVDTSYGQTNVTVTAAELGDLSETAGGIAPWGPAKVVLTGELTMPNGVLGAYNGTLCISGEQTRVQARMLRLGGELTTSTGCVEIVDGADVTLSGASLFGTIDSSMSYLKIDNSSLKTVDGRPQPIFGNCTKSRAVLEMTGDQSYVQMAPRLGNSPGSFGGAIYQRGGRFDLAGNTAYLGVHSSAYIELTGGEMVFTNATMYLSYSTNVVGNLFIDGGCFRHQSTGNSFRMGALGQSFANVYVKRGGVLLEKDVDVHMGAYSDTVSGAQSVITLAGAEAVFKVPGPAKGLLMAPHPDALAVVNLNGGVLEAPRLSAFKKSEATRTFVNFNGGTLKAAKSNSTLIDGNVTRATVYEHGATIDTAEFDVALAVPLQAPAAGGVASIPWTETEEFFIGSPGVKITGDGEGATAYAHFDSVTKRVTHIEVTSPGKGYTHATARVWYGGDIVPKEGDANAPYYREWIIDCEINAEAQPSGGLVKKGAGTLTLNQPNTYTGDTVVVEGTLVLGTAGALPAQSALVVQGGTVSVANGVVFPAIRFGFDEDALDESVTYPIADFTGTVPAQLPTLLDRNGEPLVLPPGWTTGLRKGVLAAYYQKGTVLIFR